MTRKRLAYPQKTVLRNNTSDADIVEILMKYVVRIANHRYEVDQNADIAEVSNKCTNNRHVDYISDLIGAGNLALVEYTAQTKKEQRVFKRRDAERAIYRAIRIYSSNEHVKNKTPFDASTYADLFQQQPPDAETRLMTHDVMTCLDDLLGRLDDRKLFAVGCFYALDGYPSITKEALAARLGLNGGQRSLHGVIKNYVKKLWRDSSRKYLTKDLREYSYLFKRVNVFYYYPREPKYQESNVRKEANTFLRRERKMKTTSEEIPGIPPILKQAELEQTAVISPKRWYAPLVQKVKNVYECIFRA